MKDFNKKIVTGLMLGTFVIPMAVYAVPSAPPSGGQGGTPPSGEMGGGNSSTKASYNGATTFSSNQAEENKTYTSTTGSQNALLVSGGTSTINSSTITKSGDSSGDDADFYGTNAAILCYNDAVLNITNANITTNGSHANAVFAYGTGTININDSTITTTSNNSGGVMVTGGGTLTANNLNVKTSGNSSAAIRSDRGGGTLTVNNGTYETDGTGSPAIYSTANIIVNDAELISTSSEGVVVEGKNSVTLNNVTLTDTNNTLNGNSETYKNIFLYQSMSGDADEGEATFTAKDSNITTNQGDTIFVTNTTATINLENNTILNNDGAFLRIQTGKWGNSGSNGGTVTLNMTNQKVEGDIIVDNISYLTMNMSKQSVLEGAINTNNEAKDITLSLSNDSVLSLTEDTYITTLNNEDDSNSNIYTNGYKLYVDGKEITGNSGTYNETLSTNNDKTTKSENNDILYYIIGGTLFVVAFGIIGFVIIRNNKNKKQEVI